MKDISNIEKRLWAGADTLRANSNFASNEYFLPVMGLIFLRHSYSRFLRIKDGIEATLPTRGGKKRELTKEDFSRKGAIFLRERAQFDYLVARPDSEDRAKAIIDAMSLIEEDYESLRGTLPMNEYQELDNDVLGRLLRILNDSALKNADGDIFGRIYEYFLTQFANLKAHDGGEFFTPVSLVQMIVNVIEPDHGTVLDPACGSGGMFVQSAHFIEGLKKRASERATFYSTEKNPTTIRLAKMNLAVHGLEGRIDKAITYYEDPHELVGRCDFLMANPPFNVDEIDADKIRRDPRVPFGLPSVNNQGKIGNGNYVWISYFDAYLNKTGRAGFIMSSQASSSGGEEARVRRDIIKSGDVDIMVAIRSNFFYTRTVPCELWFLNRAKPKAHRDKVLMLDARGVYRKVTRKIYDFSPEQLKNLTSIVWLYRGESERFVALVAEHLAKSIAEGVRSTDPAKELLKKLAEAKDCIATFFKSVMEEQARDAFSEFENAAKTLDQDIQGLSVLMAKVETAWAKSKKDMGGLKAIAEKIGDSAETCHGLVRDIDHTMKLFSRTVDLAEKELDAKENWSARDVRAAHKALDEARSAANVQLKLVRYFYRHAYWLLERFPDAKLRDVPGLVALTSYDELEKNDWSLTPGRYVGNTPEQEDEDFDFEQSIRDIHIEIEGLNAEAIDLARRIKSSFEVLAI